VLPTRLSKISPKKQRPHIRGTKLGPAAFGAPGALGVAKPPSVPPNDPKGLAPVAVLDDAADLFAALPNKPPLPNEPKPDGAFGGSIDPVVVLCDGGGAVDAV